MSGGITEADKLINARVKEVVAKKGRKMSQVALEWVRGKGAVPIVGLTSTSVERLEDACKLRECSLSEEDMRYLEELYVPKPIAGHV